MKKPIWIGIAIIIIIVIVIITVIMIKRNRTDYYIPGAENYSGENTNDSQSDLFGEDVFYEEDFEDFDYSKYERVNKGKLKEAQEIYNKVSLGDSMNDIINVLGQPNKIEKDEEDPELVSISYVAPGEEYNVNFCLEDDTVYEKNLYLLPSVKSGVFLSSELGTEIEDISTLVDKIKEEMTLEEVTQILGDKYYESRQDDDSGRWLSWGDKLENEISIAFDGGVVVEIVY